MSSVAPADRALELAGEALAALDVEGAVTHLSAAIRGYTTSGEARAAAMASVRLGDLLANGMGNLTAGRAWFARAAAMLRDEPPCVEQGWVAVAAMGCDVGEPEELLAGAELALRRAREFGDVNLEMKALADGGLAHVQAGRVQDGMAMLDEAMALACGPADDVDTTGKSACSFFTACYYSADFERAGSWADLMRSRGIIGSEAVAPAFLRSHCAAVEACLLCELGRWSEAEALLTRASAEFEAAVGLPSLHPAVVLADLRIRQGRLADAEILLLGKDQAFEALLPAARLHLARGALDLAVAAARRGLRALGSDRLRAIELLTVLVDAHLADGDVPAAAEASADLDRRLRDVDNPILLARTAVARARVLEATGEVGPAIEHLEDAVDDLAPGRAPYQRLRLLVELAALHDRAGDRASAVLDAQAASSTLADLDVVLEPWARALIDQLAGTDRGHRPPTLATLAPSGTRWTVASAGVEVRLRDTKGMRYLAVLLADPGVERHVLDLVDRIEGVAARGGVDRRALGDAGEVVDGQARVAYRRRIEALRGEIEDALAVASLDRAEQLQGELDELVGHLASAFGLGGRSRRASSAVERARVNVTRALRTAIAAVADVLPAAGASLDRHVRTGTYCAYEQTSEELVDDVRWIVQSRMNEDGAH